MPVVSDRDAGSPVMNESRHIRRELRRRRRELSPHEQRGHSIRVARNLSSWMPFLKARSLAVYFNADGEVNLEPVINTARSSGKVLYLPVLHPFSGNRLWFREWREDELLQPNRFLIPEPGARIGTLRHGLMLDMVLLPLVAFDNQCSRLGMGGGFYDRTFGFRKRNNHWRRPLLVGIAHDMQRLPKVVRNRWDVPLDAVITEQQRYSCSM